MLETCTFLVEHRETRIGLCSARRASYGPTRPCLYRPASLELQLSRHNRALSLTIQKMKRSS